MSERHEEEHALLGKSGELEICEEEDGELSESLGSKNGCRIEAIKYNPETGQTLAKDSHMAIQIVDGKVVAEKVSHLREIKPN